MDIIIRNELEKDYRSVEEVTKLAFWNHHAPGCDEHYLVHIMRNHEDFIPELDYVIEKEGQIIGNVMYAKSKLVDEEGNEKTVLTFGPISIHPDFQRSGYGKALLEKSFERAIQLGYDTIVIFGHPSNYVARGFKSCMKYQVCIQGDIYPTALLVKELIPGALAGKKWTYYESEAYEVDEKEAEKYDESFPYLEKKYLPCQEEFYIYSHSSMK